MGPTLIAISRGAPERLGPAHNDYSESAYVILHPDDRRVSQQSIRVYPDGFKKKQPIQVLPWWLSLRDCPERWKLIHNDYSELEYTGLHSDSHLSELICYMCPILMATNEKHPIWLLSWWLFPREPLERWGLTYNDCSELAYISLHPDDHPSESIAYTGPTLTVTREKQPISVLPWQLSLGRPLERWGLAHNDCLDLAYTNHHRDGHPSELTAYTGPTLLATRKNSLYGPTQMTIS